jgi:hypothetical protein
MSLFFLTATVLTPGQPVEVAVSSRIPGLAFSVRPPSGWSCRVEPFAATDHRDVLVVLTTTNDAVVRVRQGPNEILSEAAYADPEGGPDLISRRTRGGRYHADMFVEQIPPRPSGRHLGRSRSGKRAREPCSAAGSTFGVSLGTY